MQIYAGKKYIRRDGTIAGPISHIGFKVSGFSWADPEGNRYLSDGRWSKVVADHYKDLVEEFSDQSSPIREITKREIVPGVYGLVEIPSEPDGFVRIRLQREAFNADELDAAASVLTQIAAVMRENQ